MALVAYGFVRLSGAYAGARSVYVFVGQTLGPRAGFVAGWALLGTYLVFPAVSISAAAVFARALLASLGADLADRLAPDPRRGQFAAGLRDGVDAAHPWF